MAIAKKARPVRRSVSLRPEIDSKVRKIAQHQKRSANRVLENLIETGLQAKETEKRRFLGLVDRLRTTTDSNELKTIKDELARLTFGS
jgi:F0F1-type ATP synthase membrane subunit b/b'